MWLALTILANFFNGGVYLFDKYFLSQRVQSAITYTFYVGVWSVGNCVFFLFNRHIPNWRWLLIDLLAGIVFITALYFWYKALRQGEATKVVPIAGAFIPLFTLLLGYLFQQNHLTKQELLAALVLITGSTLLSVGPPKSWWTKLLEKIKKIFQPQKTTTLNNLRLVIHSLTASLVFAIYYILIKFIYDQQGFANSFVWTRLGSFLGALLLLIPATSRQLILRSKPRQQNKIKNWPLFLFIRLIAFLAFAMTNLAISLVDVSLINSLQGLQYLFLIIIAFFLANRYPKILKKEVHKKNLGQKLAGIVLISLGLFLLL